MFLCRKILLCVVLSLSSFVSSFGQELLYDVEFETYFDNREYGVKTDVGDRSSTTFQAAFAPMLTLCLDGHSSFSFGVQSFVPFDEAGSSLFSTVEAIIYYGLDTERWSVAAGIFPRSRMAIESYSTAFFTEDYLFLNRLVSGVMAQWRREESFAELVVDWESQSTYDTRERFRVLSAARRYWTNLYLGYNLSLTHFAGMDRDENDIFGNTVDNLLFNPRVGGRFEIGGFDVDLSGALLLSIQRDRSFENEWLLPSIGEVSLDIRRWGFELSQSYYFGEDIYPLYDGHTIDDGLVMEYGSLLYTGDPFFRVVDGFYNRASLGYSRDFFDGLLSVGAYFVTHANGETFGTQQLFDVKLKIGGRLYSRPTK